MNANEAIVAACVRDLSGPAMMPIIDCTVGGPGSWVVLGHLTRLRALKAFVRGLHAYGDAYELHGERMPDPDHQWAEIGHTSEGGWWLWLRADRYPPPDPDAPVVPVTVIEF